MSCTLFHHHVYLIYFFPNTANSGGDCVHLIFTPAKVLRYRQIFMVVPFLVLGMLGRKTGADEEGEDKAQRRSHPGRVQGKNCPNYPGRGFHGQTTRALHGENFLLTGTRPNRSQPGPNSSSIKLN